MGPEEAEKHMAEIGLCYCLWTTHSHTPETPRYRLLFPLDGTLVPEHLRRVYGLLSASLEAFNNVVDTSCFHPARLFFLPSVHPDRSQHYQWAANIHGKRLKAVTPPHGLYLEAVEYPERYDIPVSRGAVGAGLPLNG